MSEVRARIAGGLLLVVGAIDLWGSMVTVLPLGAVVPGLSTALVLAIATLVALVLAAVVLRAAGAARWAAVVLAAAGVLGLAQTAAGIGIEGPLGLTLVPVFQALYWLRELAFVVGTVGVAATASCRGPARWALLLPAGVGTLLLLAQYAGALADVAVLSPLGALLAAAWLAAGLAFVVAPPVRRSVPIPQEALR